MHTAAQMKLRDAVVTYSSRRGCNPVTRTAAFLRSNRGRPEGERRDDVCAACEAVVIQRTTPFTGGEPVQEPACVFTGDAALTFGQVLAGIVEADMWGMQGLVTYDRVRELTEWDPYEGWRLITPLLFERVQRFASQLRREGVPIPSAMDASSGDAWPLGAFRGANSYTTDTGCTYMLKPMRAPPSYNALLELLIVAMGQRRAGRRIVRCVLYNPLDDCGWTIDVAHWDSGRFESIVLNAQREAHTTR